jgi:glycosyltransferase involved in cell wall biosynthesis
MSLLSIITINLNNCKGLEKTIKSVISQQFTDYEFIVIDGGSSDGSLECIKAHQNYIHYWVSEPDKGIYNAMNKGIAQAKGDYCLFLNSGDWLVENVIMNGFGADFEEDIIYGNSYLAHGNGAIEELKYPSRLSMRYFFSATIGHQCTFIKRALLNAYGGYTEKFKIHADYEFWIKTIVIGNCSVKRWPVFVSYYDMSGISSQPNEWSQNEHKAILNTYFSANILADYDYWKKREKEMEILMWYKRQQTLYPLLVLFYKMVKNIRKLLKMSY